MRFLKILPIIAIAFLAACKSTVPQSERLLEERVSPAGEISSSSAELLDSSIIFERIKNYVFDSVLFDMKENYYVKTDCGCGCSWPDVFSCDVQYDKEKVHLNMLSLNKKYQFILNIENGIATVKKIFTDYDDEKINDLCAKHKSDPKKQNVACNNNSIAFSFNDDFSGYDLRNLGGMYFQTDCNFAMAFLRGICNSNYMNEQNRPNIIDELE